MPLDIGAMLLYTGLFLPCGIFALFHLQTFSVLNSLKQRCEYKER